MALGQNTRAVGMAKPHIGFVLQGLGAGGSERIVSLLCNHFAAQAWTVTLFAFEDRDTTPYYPHHPAVRIMPLGLKSEKMPLFGAFKAVRARSAEHPSELVTNAQLVCPLLLEKT